MVIFHSYVSLPEDNLATWKNGDLGQNMSKQMIAGWLFVLGGWTEWDATRTDWPWCISSSIWLDHSWGCKKILVWSLKAQNVLLKYPKPHYLYKLLYPSRNSIRNIYYVHYDWLSTPWKSTQISGLYLKCSSSSKWIYFSIVRLSPTFGGLYNPGSSHRSSYC